jgi:hypothetical protein
MVGAAVAVIAGICAKGSGHTHTLKEYLIEEPNSRQPKFESNLGRKDPSLAMMHRWR